jgi:hypothetical protein
VSDLFPGAAKALPEGARGGVGFGYTFLREGARAAEPVRHASGYEPFAAFATAAGADVAALATDLAALGAFAHAHREALTDPALAEAAALFLGNVLIAVHPRASWRMRSEPEVGTEAVSMPVRGAFARMRDEPAFTARMAGELLAHWADADRRHDEEAAAMSATVAATEGATLTEVPDLVVPPLVTGPFLDEHGEPIPYGDRWEHPEGPPEDACSRVTNPERFAPLVDATRALIAHLEQHYDVARTTDPDGAVVLRPRVGAPVRFRFTDFPAVSVRAGLLVDETLPSCGCDACDETAASAMEELVDTVQAVVAGGFAERPPGRRGSGGWSLRSDGGSRNSGTAEAPEDPLVPVEAVVALGGAAWPAWPRRT